MSKSRLSDLLSSLLLLVTCIVSLVTGYANPLPCTGICNDTHDPSLIKRASDGTYYRFATGGGLDIHTAPTIEGPWVYAGVILPNGSKIDNPGSDDAWAPDVHCVDGIYYCYYAVSSFGTQESVIGLATSKTMAPGTWTDHGSIGLASHNGSDYNCIDPNLFQAEDGNNYMTFGSFWGDIFQTTMGSHARHVKSGETPYEIELNNTGTRPSEGSYVYKHGGYYYLFFSSGICCGYDTTRPAPGEEYKIMVCRSEKIDGGYVDESGTSCLDNGGTEVLGSHGVVYGPGGEGVYDDPKLGPVLYYHYVNTTIGYADADKVLGINVIHWKNGWPTV